MPIALRLFSVHYNVSSGSSETTMLSHLLSAFLPLFSWSTETTGVHVHRTNKHSAPGRLDILCLEASAALQALFIAIGILLVTPVTLTAQSAVQRDSQALAILTRMIAAEGGSNVVDSVQDFIEQGTATYNLAEQVSGEVSIKGRGIHRLNIEVDLSDGKRRTVVYGDGGSLIEADGRKTPILRQSATILRSSTLPFLPLIAAMRDSSLNIIYGGLADHNGTPAYNVRIQHVYTHDEDPSGNRGLNEARNFYIDPKSFLVSAVCDRIHQGKSSRDEGVSHEFLYSNFQSESGLMVPLTVVETVRGVTGLTLNLSQVTFTSALADSDFKW